MFDRLKKVYQGKKVFLTGHTGFKGAWLLKIFSMLGAEIKGYALPPQNEIDLYNLINGNALCDSCIADLRDRKLLTSAVLDFQPDFIFHLAAQPLVRYSYEFPSDTFEINAIGTANLLDALRAMNKRVNTVLITTDKVYHNNEWVYPYRERDRLGGYDPYSASKACAELVIESYRNSFFNTNSYEIHKKAIAVGRAGNVIGGGDWSTDRLIPDIVKAFLKKEPVVIRNPNSVRPWQHVLEPLVGYLVLGMNLESNPLTFSQAYNFGPNLSDSLIVESMIKLVIDGWGDGSYIIERSKNNVHEAGLLRLDINKTISELKWEPKMNAKSAVETTIAWYKEFSVNPLNIDQFTASQIYQFIDG